MFLNEKYLFSERVDCVELCGPSHLVPKYVTSVDVNSFPAYTTWRHYVTWLFHFVGLAGYNLQHIFQNLKSVQGTKFAPK